MIVISPNGNDCKFSERILDMINTNKKSFGILSAILDGLMIFLSAYLSYWLRFDSNLFSIKGYYLTFAQYAKLVIYIIPFYLLIYWFCHLYESSYYMRRRYELANIIKANGIGFLLLTLCLYLLDDDRLYSRKLIMVFFVVNMFLCFVSRNIIRSFLRMQRKRGIKLRHVILAGYSPAATAYIDRLVSQTQLGYKVDGILADNIDSDFVYRGVKKIGDLKDLESLLMTNAYDEVTITLGLKDYDKLEGLVNTCEKCGVHTKFVPDYYNFIATKPYTEDLNGLPIIHIRNLPLSNFVNRFIKRLIDIVGSIIAIILFSGVMVITAILVKLSSPGPIIFKQVRVGLHNKEFNMYKFRSMGVQPASKEKQAWTTSNDPRVTKIGKIIRKTSIDELPQFFNVLMGNMSLIGPRPERPYFVEKFKEESPRYMIKHQVRPGITGWAQVNGYRGDTSIRGRIEHDLYYIENWSLWLDIKIVFLTIFKGFVNKNAY